MKHVPHSPNENKIFFFKNEWGQIPRPQPLCYYIIVRYVLHPSKRFFWKTKIWEFFQKREVQGLKNKNVDFFHIWRKNKKIHMKMCHTSQMRIFFLLKNEWGHQPTDPLIYDSKMCFPSPLVLLKKSFFPPTPPPRELTWNKIWTEDE